ncbi:MAG: thiamine phosphate synthase [Lachnospiraceae bacterium]|nr:thiamine phosphate synthase [Lachnospiraceae bacterium]
MNCKKGDLLLYAVTDRTWLSGDTLASRVQEAIEGGVTFIQLREKNLEREETLEEAKKIKEVCARSHIPFVINDDVELALQVDADGVHVGQRDMEAGAARRRLGPNKILGVTARTVEQALAAEKNGADYLGVGAAFVTGSKKDAKKISHETLREICEAVQIPVVAIGGIGEENVEQLAGTGICGVAVISAVFAKPDVKAAAQRLREKVLRMLSK